MGRRGHSTTIGKFAKIYQDRRVSEIRRLGEALHAEQRTSTSPRSRKGETPPTALRCN